MLTKTDIFSGFLGAGKTTLIKKLIAEAYKGEKVVLIENEFGEIAIDGGFLRDAGVQITEMNSGCICCTLVGDFTKALGQVIEQYHPDRIIIEPSGVGKLSDVARAVQSVEGIEIGLKITVIDSGRAKLYMRNFGEFFNDQVANADILVFSRTQDCPEKLLNSAIEIVREINAEAPLITTSWDKIDGKKILEAQSLGNEIKELEHVEHHCSCGCEDGDGEHHHHHHHADEIFVSWGKETAQKFSSERIETILSELEDDEKYGIVLRAKGFVDSTDGNWIYFDYVPGEPDIRTGESAVSGRVCVIGSKLNEDNLKELFSIEK